MKEREKIINELRKTNEISNAVEKKLLTHSDAGFWINISRYQKLNEDFIRKFKDCVDWEYISVYQKLSENFIRELRDYVDWYYIPKSQKLSKDFMWEFRDYVDWDCISMRQKLSEDFIREFKGRVNWVYISRYQKLSESFIEEMKEFVNWYSISIYQKLSENSILKFKDYVDWEYISTYQILSESFIEEMKEYVTWDEIARYQKVSEAFIQKFNIQISEDNWRYKDVTFKKEQVMNTGLYECHENYFIAYKGIRSDRYSNFNFQYQYLPNETYTCHADCTDGEDSFGLSAWTKAEAGYYCNELVVKVKVCYDDVARVVHNGGKIRCSKFTILD